MFATGCVVFEVFIYFVLSSIYYSCNLGEKGYWKPVIEIPLELCIINKKNTQRSDSLYAHKNTT